MLCEREVPTPLGPVRVSLTVDTGAETVHTETVVLPSEAKVVRWWTDSRLEVRCLVVRYDEVWNTYGVFTAEACWGVAWSVLTERETSAVTVCGRTPPGLTAGTNWGEDLAAVEVESPEWTLHVGGPNDLLLPALVESQDAPASWRGRLSDETVTDGPDGLTWSYPPLQAREVMTTHVAIAWAPTSAAQPVTTWLAVDTDPKHLLDYAGLTSTAPARRGWRHVPRP
ncbi:hypothetical protein AB6N24_21740 [Cellulomonas sp. 179-A 4D5 NHS]|uniref:hypothetical protein n=1 Tax=Cellulomonas sp. 179-A 4D5 NHS TaxID=3142378 RepID=UPI0039A13322